MNVCIFVVHTEQQQEIWFCFLVNNYVDTNAVVLNIRIAGEMKEGVLTSSRTLLTSSCQSERLTGGRRGRHPSVSRMSLMMHKHKTFHSSCASVVDKECFSRENMRRKKKKTDLLCIRRFLVGKTWSYAAQREVTHTDSHRSDNQLTVVTSQHWWNASMWLSSFHACINIHLLGAV